MKVIFIGGCPRSGTTFLGGLLGKHNNIFFLPELNFKLPLLQEAAKGTLNYEKAKSIFLNHRKSKVYNLGLRENDLDLKDLTNYNLAREIIINVVRSHQQRLNAEQHHENIFVDHTPSNFWVADELLKTFPGSPFIHIIRDGRGVFSSVKNLTWGPNIPTQAAQWWMANLSFGLELEARKNFPVMRVRYEDLLTDTNFILRSIFSFIKEDFEGINWQKKIIVPQYIQPQHQLVGKEPEKKKINEWQTKLSQREIELFEYASLGLLKNLGYSHYAVHPIKKASSFELIELAIKDKFLKYSNRQKKKKRYRNYDV